jgi:hypothetical protein
MPLVRTQVWEMKRWNANQHGFPMDKRCRLVLRYVDTYVCMPWLYIIKRSAFLLRIQLIFHFPYGMGTVHNPSTSKRQNHHTISSQHSTIQFQPSSTSKKAHIHTLLNENAMHLSKQSMTSLREEARVDLRYSVADTLLSSSRNPGADCLFRRY